MPISSVRGWNIITCDRCMERSVENMKPHEPLEDVVAAANNQGWIVEQGPTGIWSCLCDLCKQLPPIPNV